MNRQRLLLVEDDPAIARTTAYALEREGFTVSHSLTLTDARTQLRNAPPDLLVLDIGLPDGSGLELCRELRQGGTLPILVLSAQGEEIDRVVGLEMGADDYVTKPFSPRELVARVKGLLRRASAPAAPRASSACGPFQIDRDGQRIWLADKPLDLTRREFNLLLDLLEHKGRIRSRDNLLRAAWGADSESTDRTVDTHIKTLRAKLHAASPQSNYIVTHRGMGYAITLNR